MNPFFSHYLWLALLILQCLAPSTPAPTTAPSQPTTAPSQPTTQSTESQITFEIGYLNDDYSEYFQVTYGDTEIIGDVFKDHCPYESTWWDMRWAGCCDPYSWSAFQDIEDTLPEPLDMEDTLAVAGIVSGDKVMFNEL
eukprot:317417_1